MLKRCGLRIERQFAYTYKYNSLLTFPWEIVGLKDVVSCVIGIYTFLSSPGKWYPRLHALIADGLFEDTGTFYVMKFVDLKHLEELFRAEVFKMLRKAGKISIELIIKGPSIDFISVKPT